MAFFFVLFFGLDVLLDSYSQGADFCDIWTLFYDCVLACLSFSFLLF
jgi:hypothetical protein